MTKFKAGDKVKIVIESDFQNYHGYNLGELVTLTPSNHGNNYFWFSEEHGKCAPFYLKESWLELALVPEPGVNCVF